MSNNMHLVDNSNRRRAARHNVHLVGELQLDRGRPWTCTVTDLGRHGMAVTTHPDHAQREPAPLPRCGEEISIRVPLAGHGRARARGIVRWAAPQRHGCRFGIYFEHCNDKVYSLLLGDGADLAPHIGTLPRGPAPADSGRALPAWFPALSGGFLPRLFERAQEVLLEQAEDAGDDDTCTLNAHAAIELWTARGHLQRAVSEQVATYLLTHPPGAGRRAALSAGVLQETMRQACRLHFSTDAHVEPVLEAFRRCVHECVQPQPPGSRRRPVQEIVLEHVETAPPVPRPKDDEPRNWLGRAARRA